MNMGCAPAGLVCFVAMMSVFAPTARAAEPTPAPSSPPEIGRVKVATSASRALTTLPLPADLIGRAEIRATPGRTVESSLAAIPG